LVVTIKAAVKLLREALGKRGEHHWGCSANRLRPPDYATCDCYARSREDQHKALDFLEATAKGEK
jgi:hypothetical protein